MKKTIVLFIIPKFHLDYAEGGAENICRLVAIELSKKYKIIILHSEQNADKKLGEITEHTKKIKSMNAFYLDEWTKNRGVVSPKFCKKAIEILAQCDLLLSFERVLKLDIQNLNQFCVLGGISYQHCIDVASSNLWQKLIVPSNFIKNKCQELNPQKNIEVIYNGINCKLFKSINKNKTYTALLPFRPDKGKGFKNAVDFISDIKKENQNYSLLITKQTNNSFSDVNFYKELEKYAIQKGVEFKYIPWQKGTNMNKVYNMCDFVLSLGSLEEGFGLTTVECIKAGKYVIAKPLGATTEILPKDNGIIFAYENLSNIEIFNNYKISYDNKSVIKGMKYIRKNYDIKKMQKKYLNLIKYVLGD